MSGQMILKGDSTPIPFFMTSATDHISGFTGGAPAVQLSKDGGVTWGNAAGTVTAGGFGWYRLIPSGADAETLGPLLLHATASGADAADLAVQVVAFSPYDQAALGLTDLAAVPSLAQIETIVPSAAQNAAAAAAALPSLAEITEAVPSAAQNAAAVANQVLTESYSTLGTPGSYTFTSILFDIRQQLYAFGFVGVIRKIFKLDGVTVAHQLTMDVAPTGTGPTQSIQSS